MRVRQAPIKSAMQACSIPGADNLTPGQPTSRNSVAASDSKASCNHARSTSEQQGSPPEEQAPQCMPRTSNLTTPAPPLLLLPLPPPPPAPGPPPLVLTMRAAKPQASTAASTASADVVAAEVAPAEVAPAWKRTSADSLSSATSAEVTPGRDLRPGRHAGRQAGRQTGEQAGSREGRKAADCRWVYW